MTEQPKTKSINEEGGNCFVIMPIITPLDSLLNYRDDQDHFKHVLENLFIPAIEKAGLKPILPIAEGAEVIQGRTIRNLEDASLVLCDTSTKNPNVFFELGIRTTLNKPVCLVRDDLTDKIPFDIQDINHHQYKHSLTAWEINDERIALYNHILKSIETSSSENQLWKHFGFSMTGQPPKEGADTSELVKYLISQIESLRVQIGEIHRSTDIKLLPKTPSPFSQDSHYRLIEFLNRFGKKYKNFMVDDQKLLITFYSESEPLTDTELAILQIEANKCGYSLTIQYI